MGLQGAPENRISPRAGGNADLGVRRDSLSLGALPPPFSYLSGVIPPSQPNLPERRKRLRDARLMWIYTPAEAAKASDLATLEAALGEVDAIQVRIKRPGRTAGPSPAAKLLEWTRRVLDLRSSLPGEGPLVFVNDRPDVARVLADEGLDGVHLGTDDLPPELARAYLGEDLLIGLSTHSALQVIEAQEQPVDYLGFGPTFPTRTKGYDRGLGVEQAWIASEASALPVFPIGGIDRINADQLEEVGRAAVGSAITDSSEPLAAARHLRSCLGGE